MAGRTWQQSLPLGGEGGYPVWVGGIGWKLILGGLISYQGNQEIGWGRALRQLVTDEAL